ncbi:MAG TPA: sulfurtransferase [Thermomicrobiales bacterium]|nr:sulfurtransferase [Thermomicrobiales bacterium]
MNSQYLVETEWLADHLDDPDLRIVDCTMYLPDDSEEGVTTASGRANYALGHIPGAAYVDLLEDLSAPERPDLYAPMPAAKQFAAVMSRLGVGEGTRVVLYDDSMGVFATRVWWMLRVFGFDDAAVLNGGWLKWTSEGRAVSTEASSYPNASFVARPRPELVASKDDVLAAIGDERVCLLNALPECEFTGDPAYPAYYGRHGHIPGSVNVPFDQMLVMQSSNQYISPDAIREAFASTGALDSERVVTYCGGGIAASQAAHLLALLGAENVALYNGSLIEWSADPDLPLVVTATNGDAA